MKNLLGWKRKMGAASYCLFALVASCAFDASAADLAGTPVLQPAKEAAQRFDAPLTLDNSVLFDFGYGKVLRLPKMMIPPEMIPKDRNQPVKSQAIRMTFIYPDMVRGVWIPDMEKMHDRARPGYVHVLNKDRFPVRIRWLYYAPENIAGLPPGEFPIDPRPAQVERNLNCEGDAVKSCVSGMMRVASGLKGIDSEHAIDYVRDHPEAAIHHPEEGGRYVEKPGSAYELSMSCSGFSGLECEAFVYSFKYGFQYRMLFPPEAVAHTHDIIMSIEKMLARWHEKK